MALKFSLELDDRDRWFLDNITERGLYSLLSGNEVRRYFENKTFKCNDGTEIPLVTAYTMFFVKEHAGGNILSVTNERLKYNGKEYKLNKSEQNFFHGMTTFFIHSAVTYEAIVEDRMYKGSSYITHNTPANITKTSASVERECSQDFVELRENFLYIVRDKYSLKTDCLTVLPVVRQLMLDKYGFYNPFYARFVIYFMRYAKDISGSTFYNSIVDEMIDTFRIGDEKFTEEMQYSALLYDIVYSTHSFNFNRSFRSGFVIDIPKYLQSTSVKNKLTEGKYNSNTTLADFVAGNAVIAKYLDLGTLHIVSVNKSIDDDEVKVKEDRIAYKVKDFDDMYVSFVLPSTKQRQTSLHSSDKYMTNLGIIYKGYELTKASYISVPRFLIDKDQQLIDSLYNEAVEKCRRAADYHNILPEISMTGI